MLESILTQSLKDLEVIVVDDCSDSSCAGIVAAFASKGLAVRLIENRERVYKKNACLLGVEQARADIIAFAEADGRLWGTEILASHVALFRASQADLLQFRCVRLGNDGRYAAMDDNAPLAERLQGKRIFSVYLQKLTCGIWRHLYARNKWLALVPALRSYPAKEQVDELFMLLFYYYHAQSYIGSTAIGYGHTQTAASRSFASMAAKTLGYRAILADFSTYLRAQGEDEKGVQQLYPCLLQMLRLSANRASISYMNTPEELSHLSDEDIHIFLECVAESLAANAGHWQGIRRVIAQLPGRSCK